MTPEEKATLKATAEFVKAHVQRTRTCSLDEVDLLARAVLSLLAENAELAKAKEQRNAEVRQVLWVARRAALRSERDADGQMQRAAAGAIADACESIARALEISLDGN